MRIVLIMALLVTTMASALAQVSDKHLKESIEMGDEIESVAHGDLNGDGKIDTAYVVGSPDRRQLNVLIATPGKDDPAFSLEGSHTLSTDKLGPASLSIKKDVLTLEDLTGGTTAMSATYKYRWDKKRHRMRLIGLDATLYSRTYAHDGFQMSWNLLTYKMNTKVLEVNKGEGDDAYHEKFKQTFEWLSNPVYMEDTPDPEMVMIDVRRK